MARDRDDIIRFFTRCDNKLLANLIRRGRQTVTPDGYPTNLHSGGRGGSELTSVEAAANARLGVDDDGYPLLPLHDPVGDTIANIGSGFHVAAALVRGLDRKVDYVLHGHEHSEGLGEASGYCQACVRRVERTSVDRLKAGYCGACYKAWTRAGKPERVAFNLTRRGDKK